MSLVFAAVCVVAVVSYAWASQVAPYATPWSAPWQVVRSDRAPAAANAAIRLAVPIAIAIALLVVWPQPASTAPVTHVVLPSPPATVPYHSGQLGMRELISVLVAMAAATVALAVVIKRALGGRLSRRVVTDAAPTDETSNILSWTDEGISEILAERDPRRAILACYAVMERRLAAIGIKRSSGETALEYARRLLERSGAPPQPIATLTELFHLAGYSTHHITESMRQSAVDSLQAMREAAA